MLSVIAVMLACTVFAVSFSSVYYILIFAGTAGLAIFFLKNWVEREMQLTMIYLNYSEFFNRSGALSFGGGYEMVSLARETVISNGY